MRHYREFSKKPTDKDLLAKSTFTVNITRLRDMIDLANRLGFESFEISALREYSKFVDLTVPIENHKSFLVTEGPGETKKYKCDTPRIEDYEENQQHLFIRHLHDDRHEQGERVTCFFRFKSMYLKFFGVPSSEPSDLNEIVNTDL